MERTAIRSSLAIAANQARIDAAVQAVGAARVGSVPALSAGVHVARDPGEDADDWHWGPSVGLALPLFDWGQGRRRRAHADWRQRERGLAVAAAQVRANARMTSVAEGEAAAAVLRLRDRVLPLYEQLMAERVLGYNAMEVSPLELLLLRQRELDARVRLAEARGAYWLARAEREQLIAGGSINTATGSMSVGGAAGSATPAPPSGGHGGH